MYRGQQDENDDAVQLAMEVDDCRHRRSHADLDGDEARCKALAASVAKKRGYSTGVVSIAEMKEMIVLCHSPVEANDPEGCGSPRLPAEMTARDCYDAWNAGDRATLAVCDQALTVRRGDLRYHQVNVIPEPQVPSPWGIMVDAKDPLNGETIASSINVWSYVNDLWARGVVDRLRYIKGELQADQLTEGADVGDWSQAAEAASGGGTLPRLTAEARQQLVSELTRASTQNPDVVPLLPQDVDASLQAIAEHTHETLRDVRSSADQAATSTAVTLARA
jgi:hypothetical protein